MQEINTGNIITQPLNWPGFDERKIKAAMLRLDLIHPLVSGNKWFKLRYYLEEALTAGKKKLITFGGAWSNHIIATAAACRLYGLSSTGIIRGEKPDHPSTVLLTASSLGMELIFTDRQSFASGKIPGITDQPDQYLVPAGGFGEPGARGAGTILEYCHPLSQYTHICCAAGTGTMMAGLINNSLPAQHIIGISVLKNNHSLEASIKSLLKENKTNYHLSHHYHFGGYAKQNEALIGFMNNWYRHNGIPTDFVYTGKLCYAVSDLAGQGFFPAGSNILIIHSGGLTGNSSLKNGTLIF